MYRDVLFSFSSAQNVGSHSRKRVVRLFWVRRAFMAAVQYGQRWVKHVMYDVNSTQ